MGNTNVWLELTSACCCVLDGFKPYLRRVDLKFICSMPSNYKPTLMKFGPHVVLCIAWSYSDYINLVLNINIIIMIIIIISPITNQTL